MAREHAHRTSLEVVPVIEACRALDLDQDLHLPEVDLRDEICAARLVLSEGCWSLREIITQSGRRPVRRRRAAENQPLLHYLFARTFDATCAEREDIERTQVEFIATRNFLVPNLWFGGRVLRPRTADIDLRDRLISAGCQIDDPLLLLYDRQPGVHAFTASAQAHRLGEIAPEISLVADIALAPGERLAATIHLC